METGQRLKVSSDRLVKPGIEPATPGLQGKRLIHYTTAAPKRKEYALSCIGNMDETRFDRHALQLHNGTNWDKDSVNGKYRTQENPHNCLPLCYGRWNKAPSSCS